MDQRAWSPFCLQCVFNILPAPSTIISTVWEGRVRKGGGGSASWRLLHVATRRRTLVEPLTLSEQREGGKKQSCHWVCWFFVLSFAVEKVVRLSGTGSKLCMWPSSPFPNRWIMCHLDCVKSAEVEFDLDCMYRMSIWMRLTGETPL